MLQLEKKECFGCGACEQVCPVKAIEMRYDEEGFVYPHIDEEKCIQCGKCERMCQSLNPVEKKSTPIYTFGGYFKTDEVLEESTSGGAFSAICNSWCSGEYMIFGAETKGPLTVAHQGITNIKDLSRLRKSKYTQSKIGQTYMEANQCLKEGKKVLFSGTPCQIAGLLKITGHHENLLTVEVVCEGVPSPLWIQKQIEYVEKKKQKKVSWVDYRDKNKRKWDFEFMSFHFEDGDVYKIARWFNPFWSVWLKHLMSRPSCYSCPYAETKRAADITLGDLWGVHLYCPELYGNNRGASLVMCNTEKGKAIWKQAEKSMYGHSLNFDDAIKYQGPMRRPVPQNEKREEFMEELKQKSYSELCEKWADKCSLKLWFQKYIWGNRQKVFVWNLLHSKKH